MNGTKCAAAIMLLLGEERSAALWEHFTEDEITALSIAMAELGSLDKDTAESVLSRFHEDVHSFQHLRGTYERTETFLRSVLSHEKAEAVIDELRGRTSQGVWRKMSAMDANTLSSFLMNEHPQTVALVMTKIDSKLAAKVLSSFATDQASGVIERMLTITSVPKDALDDLEQALSVEFILGNSRAAQRNQFEAAADIFNSMDRGTEERLMSSLLKSNQDAGYRVRKLMFTFEDVAFLNDTAIQTILRYVDKAVLAKALRGAKDSVKTRFLQNMSARSSQALASDIEMLGPMRAQDIEAAQAAIVETAKDLEEKGDIVIGKGEELI